MCYVLIYCFQVYDQYIDFITLEDDLFILKHQNSDFLSYYGKQLSQVVHRFTSVSF